MSTLTDQPAPADPADPAAAAALSATSSGLRLRQRAEAAFREQAAQLPEDRAALSPEATQRLLDELQVHQIELEMENEELRAQVAGHCDRIAAQSEILSSSAEKVVTSAQPPQPEPTTNAPRSTSSPRRK